MSIKNEIKILHGNGIVCIDCDKPLDKFDNHFKCSSCKRAFVRNVKNVWNFIAINEVNDKLSFYEDDDYVKWRQVFAETEVDNWAIYQTSFRRFFSQAGHRVISRELLQNKNGIGTVLEIGAGTGVLLENIPGLTYIALDHSMASLAKLKQRFPAAIALCTSGVKIPFGRNSFSTVCSLHTLEHIYQIAEHLEEVTRVLNSNGMYHYVIPTEGGFSFWLGRQLITGPHLEKTYGLNINRIMEREHINDAKRVLKFLDMYFDENKKEYWPMRVPVMSLNAMIAGSCKNV
jgi:ubiquinone/menaquinone biosynthesis C-methylase UbiE